MAELTLNILAVLLLCGLALAMFYGFMAIIHHFYPEDPGFNQVVISQTSTTESRECFKNGVSINCSDFGLSPYSIKEG